MTLIELLIALVIVILVLAAAFWSFARLFQGFKSQTKVSEAHISSIIAFELLRKDLEMAGFGVPYNCSGITFSEAAPSTSPPPDPSTYNVTPLNVTPFTLDDNGNPAGNSDYLVIRAAFSPYDGETTKWAYFKAENGTCPLTFGDGPFSENTNVVVEDGEDNLRAIQTSGTNWRFRITSASSLNTCPDCMTDQHFYLVYGIASDNDTSPDIRAPFNRVDYYLATPTGGLPARCSSTTYELYRAQMNHKDGTLNRQPVLDCARDFQVAFKIDASWNSTLSSVTSASDQKEKIKEVRVFVLYQEGQKEREEVSNGTITLGDSDTGALSTFTPTGDERHYRWRVKEISVKPMNLGR